VVEALEPSSPWFWDTVPQVVGVRLEIGFGSGDHTAMVTQPDLWGGGQDGVGGQHESEAHVSQG